MDHPQAPARVRRRTSALTILVIAGTLNYLDRSTLSIANPLIRHDLGLSIADMGLLLRPSCGPTHSLSFRAAHWWTGSGRTGCSPPGSASGRWRRRPPDSSPVSGSSPLPACSSAWRGADVLLRGARGAGLYTCATAACRPGSGTARPRSVPAIAPPILTALMLTFGWRWMFIVMGVVGLAVAALWYVKYRDAAEFPFDANERHYLRQGEEAPSANRVTLAEWGRLFRFRTTWGLILGFFGVVYMGWLYLAWLPGYFEIQRHMSIPKTGWVFAIPFAFGVVGSIGGGAIADLSDGCRSVAGQQPQTAGDRRVAGHGRVHHRGGGDAEQHDRGGLHFGGADARCLCQRDVVGTGKRGRAIQLHGFPGCDPEFRRLPGRRAGTRRSPGSSCRAPAALFRPCC